MLVFDYPTSAALAEYMLGAMPIKPLVVPVAAGMSEKAGNDAAAIAGNTRGGPKPVWLHMTPPQRLVHVVQLVRLLPSPTRGVVFPLP